MAFDLLKNFNFFRAHNSHLVNLNFVKCYDKGKERGSGGFAITTDNSKVPVAYRKKEMFIKILTEFNSEDCIFYNC